MNWSESISRAIEYIENNLTNNITIEDISNYSYISPFYFQKGFAIVCGYRVSEYIRNRKLSLAGYNIEMYSNPKDYKKGIDDEKYYCEIWIPIKKKQ